MFDDSFMSNPQEWAAGHEGFSPANNSVGDMVAPGWHDDVDAFVYYGSFGLLDPKMPFEAYGYKRAFGLVGWRGLAIGAGISMSSGFLLAGTVGYIFDPADRREGGIMQSEAWKEIVTPGRKKFLHFR